MNIMLVAVTERIREIGLRKALGATPFGIADQFLLESIILSLSGGLIGLTLGIAASLFARRFIRTETPLWALLLSVGFSLAIGVIFGTYPAYKASKKEPIEALRYE
jgi:putative ABC transport system permease protein